MKTKIISILLLAGTLILSCTSQKKATNLNAIAVKWEVVSNTEFNEPKNLAAFTLYNNSEITLDSSNWNLYFSQAPRGIIPDSVKKAASVVHLGGDYFKLKPNQGFKLAPGDSIRIEYLAEAWYIKESDAPMGLYFVIATDDKKEQIVSVTNYTIAPFIRPEQINRFKNDKEPIPTPEWQYYDNAKLSLLPKTELLPIIPQPASVKMGKDSVSMNSDWYILCNSAVSNESSFLQSRIKQLLGFDIQISENPVQGKNPIKLELLEKNMISTNIEAYTLQTEKSSIEIKAVDPAGIYYGIQSLLMLFPAGTYLKPNSIVSIPQLYISDAPRYSYRGMHIDVSRNFQKKRELMRIIDVMAMYKLNRLHLYMTEDEGWRVEIKALPELTTIGSKRGHTTTETDMLHPAYGSGPFSDPEISNGSGYYTQDDFIEIIQYAYKNHILVIPSINFPGHARAAIKSMEVRYNNLMKQGKEKEATEFRLVEPEDKSVYRSVQGYNDNVVNVALESTYHFYETVVDEVIAMYKKAGVPLDILHTGGDEVPEGVWAKSPACEKLMADLGNISEAKNLQQYFVKRIVDILSARNLKAAGWEEMTLKKNAEGKYVVNTDFAGGEVIPYVWNNLSGSQDLAYRLTNSGYPIVFCGVTNLYFDLAYNKDPKEPGLYWGGFTNERAPWQINPENLLSTIDKDDMGRQIDKSKEYAGMTRLDPKSANKILGLQAQLWAETVHGPDMLEHLLLPKLMSFAERCWSPAPGWQSIQDDKKRNEALDQQWNIFINSVSRNEIPRLTYFNNGYNFRVPPPGAVIENGILKANSQYPGSLIYFTTDGSTPDENSMEYTKQVEVSGTIKLIAIAPGGRKSPVVTIGKK